MSKERRLLKDSVLYGVANFGSKIISFIMLPIYTHYFSTAQYGFWDLSITAVSLFIPFITFEITAAVYRWLLDEPDEDEKKSIITSGIITISRNLLLLNALAILILTFLSIPYGWFILLLINVTVYSSFLQQCARGLGHNKLFAALGISQSIMVMILNLLFLFVFHLGIEALFYSYIIAHGVNILISWFVMEFQRFIVFSSYSRSFIRSFYRYSLPIIPGAVSWWVMNMSDRYIITVYLGVEYNGLYAIANQIPAVLYMVNTVFFLAWKDSAIRESKSVDRNDYYSTVFRYFFRLMVSSVICIILLTKPIFEFIIADDFYPSWKYTGLLLLGALFSSFSQFWGAGYHGAKKTNVIFYTSFAGAVINILFNILFIDSLGLYAAAISTLLAFMTMWIIRIVSSKKHFKIAIPTKDILMFLPLLIGALLAPFIFKKVALMIYIVVSLLLFIFVNYSLGKYVLMNLKNIAK